MPSNAAPSASKRTTIRRMPQRAVYDRAAINAILDEGLICHVGFNIDGQPFVLPTIYARDGERLLIHGSAASRMLRAVRGGIPMCATVTLIDGLVLARSAYHHSMNYRSVVVLGAATEVGGHPAKLAAMRTIVNHVIPRRWDQVRSPSDMEIRATMILSLPIDEVSAKVRTGPPIDDEEDYALKVWAGVLPLSLDAHGPIADAQLPVGIELPSNVRFYRRGSIPGGLIPSE